MESSGVYWKPVWNILEREFTIVLANAQHIKNVPGRKTDQKDAEWIAQLLQHGLLRASYVPCEIIRDLRDLTRMRASLSQEVSRLSSRIQKVLEDANVKLSSVATNVLGKSGRAMLEDIISGEDDPEHLACPALGHLRVKIPQLRLALAGKIRAHHRFLLSRPCQLQADGGGVTRASSYRSPLDPSPRPADFRRAIHKWVSPDSQRLRTISRVTFRPARETVSSLTW